MPGFKVYAQSFSPPKESHSENFRQGEGNR